MPLKNSQLTLISILRLGAIALILGQIGLTVWIIGNPVSGLGPANTAVAPAQTIAAGAGYNHNDVVYPAPHGALNSGDGWLEVKVPVQLALFQALIYGYDARILALALILGLFGLILLAWTQRDPNTAAQRWWIEEDKF
jgi:hypothetical protein